MTTSKLIDWVDIAPPPLRLPVRGKVYEIPPVSIGGGMKLRGVNLAATGGAPAEGQDAMPDDVFLGVMFGADLMQRLIDDDVPADAVLLMARVAYVDYQLGRESSTAMWSANSDPETLARSIEGQVRRVPAKKAPAKAKAATR